MPISILNDRQQRFYQQRMDVWRPIRQNKNAQTLEPGGALWVRVLLDEPVRYVFTQNIDQATVGGRITEPGEFTRDAVHAAANLPLQNGDAIVNKTILPSGARSIRFGQVTLVQGDPNVVEGIDNWLSKQTVEGITTPQPPDWIVQEYANIGEALN